MKITVTLDAADSKRSPTRREAVLDIIGNLKALSEILIREELLDAPGARILASSSSLISCGVMGTESQPNSCEWHITLERERNTEE